MLTGVCQFKPGQKRDSTFQPESINLHYFALAQC